MGWGLLIRKSRIALLTDDELVLIDNNKGKGIFYIENYKKCTGGETEVLDTRTTVNVVKTSQLSVGAQFLRVCNFKQQGFSLLKSDWKKTEYLLQWRAAD